MDQRKNGEQIYLCPMHSDVRQQSPDNCPKRGMALLRGGRGRHVCGSNVPGIGLKAVRQRRKMSGQYYTDAPLPCVLAYFLVDVSRSAFSRRELEKGDIRLGAGKALLSELLKANAIDSLQSGGNRYEYVW